MMPRDNLLTHLDFCGACEKKTNTQCTRKRTHSQKITPYLKDWTVLRVIVTAGRKEKVTPL